MCEEKDAPERNEYRRDGSQHLVAQGCAAVCVLCGVRRTSADLIRLVNKRSWRCRFELLHLRLRLIQLLGGRARRASTARQAHLAPEDALRVGTVRGARGAGSAAGRSEFIFDAGRAAVAARGGGECRAWARGAAFGASSAELAGGAVLAGRSAGNARLSRGALLARAAAQEIAGLARDVGSCAAFGRANSRA